MVKPNSKTVNVGLLRNEKFKVESLYKYICPVPLNLYKYDLLQYSKYFYTNSV